LNALRHARNLAVTAALSALALMPAGAQTTTPSPLTRASKAFRVSHAPPGPWDVYVTLARLPAGFWTGPHTHPGPEFGLIVAGEALRWDAGKQRVARAGDGYFAPAGEIHEGGATVDGTLQLSVHLVPQGREFQRVIPVTDAPAAAPRPTATQERLFQSKFSVDAVPESPFNLAERIIDLPPGATLTSETGGLGLSTVIAGRVMLTQSEGTTLRRAGDSWTRNAGDSVVVRNQGPGTASLMVATLGAPG
jgi:quercetin dioxygenase-like cupin family protein